MNPVPYQAPLFGYKDHMDQNEKLEMYGCTHVVFIDYIFSFASSPVKNPVLIYKYLFRYVLLLITLSSLILIVQVRLYGIDRICHQI